MADTHGSVSAAELLCRPTVSLENFYGLMPKLAELDDTMKERLLIEGRYKPFLKRQAQEVAALKRDENLKLDINTDYMQYDLILRLYLCMY